MVYKLSLLLLFPLIMAGCSSTDPITGGDVYIESALHADSVIADVEGHSIDVVQVSELGIALTDTISIVFAFEPSLVTLDYSAKCLHDASNEAGHTTGHCVIIITGVNTMTSNLNMTALVDDNGSIGVVSIPDNTTKVIIAYGGNDGASDSNFRGSGSWNTGTHTLTIVFDVDNDARDIFNFVEIVATAYK